jgi:hypothetical protein
VRLSWLIEFIVSLQEDLNAYRRDVIERNERALSHNRAGDWGMHDLPRQHVENVPPPALLNVHGLVERIVKPLTIELRVPFIALVPEQHRGPPTAFISHTWNSVLVGPARQRVGTLDALEDTLPASACVWIDFACYNQHSIESIKLDMQRVIEEIGSVSFVATPVPLFNRSWCLWELDAIRDALAGSRLPAPA